MTIATYNDSCEKKQKDDELLAYSWSRHGSKEGSMM